MSESDPEFGRDGASVLAARLLASRRNALLVPEPHRKLLMGDGGIPVEQFLLTPIANWGRE